MPFTVTMPKLSPTMQEGTITKWHKKVGDKVNAGDILVDIATDKATVEFNAIDDGFLRKILIQEGQSGIVNQPMGIFTELANDNIEGYQPEGTMPQVKEEKKPAATKEEAPKSNPTTTIPQAVFQPLPPLENYEFGFPTDEIPKRTPASPLAKKIAKEKGLDMTTVKGTGPGGRITSHDLNLAQPDLTVTFGRREKPTIVPGTFEEIPLSPMRKTISQRLQSAKNSIPHIYVHQEIDAEALFNAHEQLKNGNLKVSINDFIIRAVALALKEHPNCNSGFNAASQSLILFKTIDISVAVSVEGGLITPIIRHADYKNIGEISLEVKELAIRAKAGKLSPQEYQGGSFTISNMGMYGVSDFCAIINPPQAAILAVGAIEECPRVKNGQVIVGKKMHLVISADHRAIDGADAAKFLKTVQKYLENPALLLA